MCPEYLQYTKEHEWVKIEGETAEIGITGYAQEQLGDVVYIELPELGAQIGQFEVCGTIESVKTVADLYAPLSGEVIAINDALDETPELVNNEPYGAGWIIKIQIRDQSEVSNLLSPAVYETLIKKK